MKDFKPFEKVLVRNSPMGLWIPALYGKCVDGKHLTSAGWQSECVEYKGNESLIGTTTYPSMIGIEEIVDTVNKFNGTGSISLVGKDK